MEYGVVVSVLGVTAGTRITNANVRQTVHPMFLQCKYNVHPMFLQCTYNVHKCSSLTGPRNAHRAMFTMFLRISWIVHPMFLQSLSEFLAMCQNLFTQCSWNVPPRFSQRPQFKLLLRICNVENSLKTIQHHSQLYISACMWQGDSKWKS